MNNINGYQPTGPLTPPENTPDRGSAGRKSTDLEVAQGERIKELEAQIQQMAIELGE